MNKSIYVDCKAPLTMFLKCALRVPVVWWYSITQLLLRISPLLSLGRKRQLRRESLDSSVRCDALQCRELYSSPHPTHVRPQIMFTLIYCGTSMWNHPHLHLLFTRNTEQMLLGKLLAADETRPDDG